MLLFVPVRLLVGLIVTVATVFWAGLLGVERVEGLGTDRALDGGVRHVFEHLLPLLIVRRDPERVLDVPAAVVRPDRSAAAADHGHAGRPHRDVAAGARGRRRRRRRCAADDADEAAHTFLEAGEHEGLIEREERALLQSIVDFGDTLVREVMTPRPDIVAIRADATLAEVRTLLAEQEYSRVPVYEDSLDHVAGIRLRQGSDPADGRRARGPRSVPRLLRPAHFVPETKRVARSVEGVPASAGAVGHRR